MATTYPAPTRKSRHVGRWILLGILLIGGIGAYFSDREEKSAVNKLNASTATYTAAKGTVTQGTAHVSGRIVPINLATGKVDRPVHEALPKALRPMAPGDVGTVARIRYGKRTVGQYSDSADAIQENATVTVVNLRTHRQYAPKYIEGPSPPTSRRNFESASGGKPTAEIADWLAGLPRG